MTQPLQRPDWVMLGVPYPDGVLLIASRELNHAELRSEYERRDSVNWDEPVVRNAGRAVVVLTAQLKRLVMVQADTYGQAFDHLFRQWRPDQPADPGPAAIEVAPRAIGPAG